MRLIRCLSCNKVLGEFDGKARVKCKMAGCGNYHDIEVSGGVVTIKDDKGNLKIYTDEVVKMPYSNEAFSNESGGWLKVIGKEGIDKVTCKIVNQPPIIK